jgi:hypothetical protein
MILPDILTASVNQVSTTTDSVLRKYQNTKVTSTGVTLAGSGIILANSATGMTKFLGRGGVIMEAQTGATYVTSLDAASGALTWYGGFVIGEDVATGTFLPTYAKVVDMGLDLKEFRVDKLARVGADVLGI